MPDPEPSTREILVRVHASGVNRADLLQRRGLYPPPPGESDIPGLEFAGTVEEVGTSVTRWSEGDRVMSIVAGGGYAEYVVVDERVAIRVPDHMELAVAGAIPEAYMTAFDAVFLQAGLRKGEILLVHALGSGVGTAALQMARHSGAHPIGTSRTDSKRRRADAHGLGLALDGDAAWDERIMQVTGGRGADVILDLVGGPYLARNQAAIAMGGRHLVVGLTGGSRGEVDLRALMARRASIFGTVLRARNVEEKARLAREFRRKVMPWFRQRAFRPVIDTVLPAAKVVEAHRRMEANGNFGKIVMVWGAEEWASG